MPTIAKWLGHADGGVLAMKVYSNVMDEHSINQSAKLKFAAHGQLLSNQNFL